MISPDEDFSQTGANSGIKYSESFDKYKEMLVDNADSPVFKRIFAKFNASLFGTTAAAPPSHPVAEDDEYDLQIRKLLSEVLKDTSGEGVTDGVSSPLLSGSSTNQSPPEPPIQSERRVSISVTSHISTGTAIAASTQISNVVNNVSRPPGEHEVEEPSPPPSPKPLSRPVPKKKGGKPSKKTTVPPESGAADETAVPDPPKATKGKTTPVDPSARTLRKRG